MHEHIGRCSLVSVTAASLCFVDIHLAHHKTVTQTTKGDLARDAQLSSDDVDTDAMLNAVSETTTTTTTYNFRPGLRFFCLV